MTTPTSPPRAARWLRMLSYGAVLLAVAWSMSGPGGSCRGVGCGGNAVVWAMGLAVAAVAAAVLNAVSFLLQGSPRSGARGIELGLFLVPLAVVLLLTVLSFM